MPSMTDLVHERTDLGDLDVEWLRLLVGDWQLLSDLSFADLVLWVRVHDGWLAVAHVRPTTGATAFVDDVVGLEVARGRRPQIDRAAEEVRICRERDPDWRDDVPVREETIPVVRDGRVVAVLARHTNLATMRTPSRLELTYVACADALAGMVSQGAFPVAGAPTGPRRGAPRVGDGMIRLDAEGVVTYASPNAVSAFHRLGHDRELVGQSLAELTTSLLRVAAGEQHRQVDEGLPLVLTGKAPWRADVEASGTALSLRAIPLTVDGARAGALLLARDVTELRRRERQLLSKDATIREIHHRVKNNLQTVGALLRLQSRRLEDSVARTALEQAERRVAAIALVHETLSTGYDEAVDFDAVAGRGLMALVEVARPGGAVRTDLQGRFGRLRAEDATALSLALTELVQNAVEHGLAGRDGVVTVRAERSDGALVVLVSDDGVGIGASHGVNGGDGDGSSGRGVSGRGGSERGGRGAERPRTGGGLGTQIVQALVAELRGTIVWTARAGGGTDVRLDLRPRPLDD